MLADIGDFVGFYQTELLPRFLLHRLRIVIFRFFRLQLTLFGLQLLLLLFDANHFLMQFAVFQTPFDKKSDNEEDEDTEDYIFYIFPPW